MEMEGTNILILNPLDKIPHKHCNGKIAVQYQHGNFTVAGDIMSITFVFKVVDEYCDYDENDNIIITIEQVEKKHTNVPYMTRERLYKSFNTDKLHKNMK